MALAFLKGLGLGGSLIIAIGAQNAFVLGHALRRNFALTIALVCSVIDASLIMVGVWGLGEFIERSPRLLSVITLGGFLFLFVYGAIAFKRAMSPGGLEASGNSDYTSAWPAIAAAVAISLLNPHVYLDTVLLVGSIGGQLPGLQPVAFAAGAILASFIWFFTLAIGGRALAPVLNSARQWQRLDFIIGLIMWAIAGSLLWSFWQQLSA